MEVQQFSLEWFNKHFKTSYVDGRWNCNGKVNGYSYSFQHKDENEALQIAKNVLIEEGILIDSGELAAPPKTQPITVVPAISKNLKDKVTSNIEEKNKADRKLLSQEGSNNPSFKGWIKAFKDGKYLGTFEGVPVAGGYLKIDKGYLNKCVNEGKPAKGYIFERIPKPEGTDDEIIIKSNEVPAKRGKKAITFEERLLLGEKTCSKCDKTKRVSVVTEDSQFLRETRNPDGFSYDCKDCRNEAKREAYVPKIGTPKVRKPKLLKVKVEKPVIQRLPVETVVTKLNLFKHFIFSTRFFEAYCVTRIKDWEKKKNNVIDHRGNLRTFTEDDLIVLAQGVEQMAKDIINEIFN